jgi:hypothetical protein
LRLNHGLILATYKHHGIKHLISINQKKILPNLVKKEENCFIGSVGRIKRSFRKGKFLV